MNFFELLQQLKEAKFTPVPGHELKKVTLEELTPLVQSLMEKYFGATNLHNWPGYNGGGGSELRMGKRHFSMSIDGICNCDEVKSMQLPKIYISFNWEEDVKYNPGEHGEEFSDKEASDRYPVRKQIQKDTMEVIHKLRFVFRELAAYAVCITFIAIGQRRSSLYGGVLASCGFKELPDCS